MTEATEAKSSKEVKGYKISSKRVVGVALYQGEKGIVPLPVVENQRVTQRGLLAILEPLHPARFVQVIASADGKVLKEGFDWPGAEQDWEAIAAEKLAAYHAEQARELQAKQAQKAAEAERKAALRKFAEAVTREPFNFADEALFQTPSSQVARKVRDLYASAFIDVVFDNHGGHRWYRFADPDGEIRDSVCPSCGGEDIVPILDSSTGLTYSVCRSQSCNFRWAKKPERCPACQHGELEVEMDGTDAYVACNNRQNCHYEAKLGHLPRVPADEHEAALAAPGNLGELR